MTNWNKYEMTNNWKDKKLEDIRYNDIDYQFQQFGDVKICINTIIYNISWNDSWAGILHFVLSVNNIIF